ncbi:MAG: hypothetical protein II187_11850 [Treponema sp.]|nr:hypothetical protein [Treponema sp.]
MSLRPPADYMLCQNSACAKAAACLRYQCFLTLSTEPLSITVLNPLRYPADGAEENCFRQAQKVRVAWGIRNLYDGIPYKSAVQIKKELLQQFGKTKYYRFFREELGIFPDTRQIFSETFKKYGIQSDPPYARFTEEYDW